MEEAQNNCTVKKDSAWGLVYHITKPPRVPACSREFLERRGHTALCSSSSDEETRSRFSQGTCELEVGSFPRYGKDRQVGKWKLDSEEALSPNLLASEQLENSCYL
ncbi:hypothetical protein E5288_WYG001682 [Bos mutus]|uniref:Uncharacterized protein n=1 Tax=Bos mutus TaxID=72004 RepID=A0A6B0RN88_9CETA|nr:hypothetical protein [Bos mutus]